MAITIKDNLNNVIFSDPNAPSGSLSASTGVFVRVIPAVIGNVHAFLGGQAITGFIPAYDGNIQARFVGVASEVTFIPVLEGNLTAFFKGNADTSFLGVYETSILATIRGIALAIVKPNFDYKSSGSIGINSNLTNPISSIYEYESNEKFTITGLATRVRIAIKNVGFTGTIGFTGTYDKIVLGFSPMVGGGLNVKGQARLSSSVYEYSSDFGSVQFSGLADVNQGYYVDATGSIILDSVVESVIANVNFDGSGSIGISGHVTPLITDIFKKNFLWRIREKVNFSKTFSWSVGERPYSFYRISGKCKSAQCPPLQLNGCNPGSKFTYVVNIYARNLSEVCRKLRDRNMIFPIATIEKFSIPASHLNYTSETDTTCNKLVDVTPPITFLPCQDLLVDYNASVNIGVDMKAAFVIACYDASGGFGLSGGEYPFDYRAYDPLYGVIGLSGVATCTQNDYKYEATSGSIGFGGTIENVTLTAWTFESTGGFNVIVDVEPVNIVHPFWFMESSGKLGLHNQSDIVLTMKWQASGHISKQGSTAFGASDFLPYVLDMTGSLITSNNTDGARGEYTYESFGNVGFSGLVYFLNPHHAVEASGRLVVSNGVGSVPNTSSNIGITANFNGAATVAFTPEYGQSGIIKLSGAASVNCSTIEPNGRMTFGGTALINCSDLGLIDMPIANEFFVKNEIVIFAYVDAPAATRPTKRITSDCCVQPLPLRLWVQHPLASANHFNHFLQRNNLLIDNPIQVYYNQAEKMWFNTVHFEGYAPDFPTRESWVITFGWSCSDHATSDLALGTAGLYYRFSMMVTLRSINNPTIPQRVTRLVVGFDPTRVCFNNKTLSFPFILDTTAKTTNPSAAQTLVYVDDIGLFKTADYLKAPEIRFKVSELVDDISQEVVNIGPAMTGSQRLGSSFGNILNSLPIG